MKVITRQFGILCAGLFVPVLVSAASIKSQGWSIAADDAQGTIEIANDSVGIVARKVRISVKTQGEDVAFQRVSSREHEGKLLVTTEGPHTAWEFTPAFNTLTISSTTYSGALKAELPAPPSRIPARTLDTAGVPVEWTGTSEVVGSYHGKMTRNPSFLPRRNSEVMYYSLGPNANPFAQALFDRSTDTAIEFGPKVAWTRTAPEVLAATIAVEGAAVIRLVPQYFVRVLGVPYYKPFDDSHFKTAPAVWSSWTGYYEAVTEADMVKSTDWIAEHLRPYGFGYVELDDGYDRGPQGEHSWIEGWDRQKFPHGPEWLTRYIRSKGMRAGIWLVPNSYAAALKEHPDWYVRYKDGRVVKDYATPALDSSNPAVLNLVKHIFETLDGWGFDYYKFDGEHAIPRYVPNVDLSKLFKSGADPLDVFRQRMALIRETIGPERFIEECPAGTPLNAIGYVDSYFNGHDLYSNWNGMQPFFNSINANGFLNHMVVYVMPGEGIDIVPHISFEQAKNVRAKIVLDTEVDREQPVTGFGLTLAEARTSVTYTALTGVVYPLASITSEITREREQLLQATLPTLPILPTDLFSRGNNIDWGTFRHFDPENYINGYPEILDVKMNTAAGKYDLIGVTNWRGGTARKTIDFKAKLGLNDAASYVAFDFWAQKVLPVVKGTIDLELPEHDTRVLLIHPEMGRPQLVGNSRHISGTYSIVKQDWEADQKMLAGQSETVAGAPYTLWFYTPAGYRLKKATARSAGQELKVNGQQQGSSLRVTFTGTKQPVDWSVQFAR